MRRLHYLVIVFLTSLSCARPAHAQYEGYTWTNSADAPFADLARLYAQDSRPIIGGLRNNSVVSGWAVTAQGSPNMSVHVTAPCTISINGANVAVSSADLTITTAHASHCPALISSRSMRRGQPS
jgi:hypothetical protein